MNSDGLLDCKISNFVGLFESLREYGINAQEVKDILDILPTFAL